VRLSAPVAGRRGPDAGADPLAHGATPGPLAATDRPNPSRPRPSGTFKGQLQGRGENKHGQPGFGNIENLGSMPIDGDGRCWPREGRRPPPTMLSFSVQHIRRTARINMPVFMSQRPVVAPAAQPQPSPRHEPRACRREAVAARRPYVAQGTGYPRWGSFPLMAGYGGRHPEFSRTTRIPVLAYIEWTAPRPAGFVACLVRSPAVFSGPTSRRWLWYIDICRIVRCNAITTHCCCCNKLTTYGPGENQEMQKPTGWDTVPNETARTSIPAPCWDHGSARNQNGSTRPLAGQCRSFEYHDGGPYRALGLLGSMFPCSGPHPPSFLHRW
jgi:hypothetical protein